MSIGVAFGAAILIIGGAVAAIVHLFGRFVWPLIARTVWDLRQPYLSARQQALCRVNIAGMDGMAFERHCAAVLTAGGWRCRMTARSWDYGIDLLAEAEGRKVAIQIKKWRAPVGLSAIQEAVAGRAMYRATEVAVVSVSGYRRSAKRLAAANQVRLLAYSDLFGFTAPDRSASR